MSAMGPVYSRNHFVNANPRDRLVGCSVLSDLLYGRFVLADGDVALHAFGGVGKSHQLARLRIGVALLAFQTEGQVLLVTVGDRLLGSGMRARIVGYDMF